MTKIRLVAHEDDLKKYPECETCLVTICGDVCFEKHPGSLIALQKVASLQGEVETVVYKDDGTCIYCEFFTGGQCPGDARCKDSREVYVSFKRSKPL